MRLLRHYILPLNGNVVWAEFVGIAYSVWTLYQA